VLLLALRLWGSMPSTLLKQTSLLPSNVQSPSTDFFTVSDTPKEAAAAAAAFFSEQHLQTVLPVLRGSSSSHPRLHSLWPTLFALLLPGTTFFCQACYANLSVFPAAACSNIRWLD